MAIRCDACGEEIHGEYHYNADTYPVCAQCWPIEQEVDKRLAALRAQPSRENDPTTPQQ